MGLPLIAVPEEQDGVGGTLADLMAMLRVAGEHAVPVPVAETALANLLVAAAGGKPAGGPSTVALGELSLQGNRVSGKVARVPFAGVAERFVAIITAGGKSTLVVVPRDAVAIEDTPSHAGEPYGTVTFDGAMPEFSAASPVSAGRALELAALARAMQMAGAADKVLATATEYCKQRVQFGRPISTFQAIQHMLAELASCVAATIASANPHRVTPTRAGWRRGAASLSPQPRPSAPTSRTGSPPYRTSLWVPWASPTSTSCITTRAGSGCGAGTSAARASGARRSAKSFARAGKDELWPALSESRYAA